MPWARSQSSAVSLEVALGAGIRSPAENGGKVTEAAEEEEEPADIMDVMPSETLRPFGIFQ